ncbi:hypothetical protein QOZ80_4BG0334190 [Eleusine coracana subsp. coracana]|nr:hypothetical protein QOZ80_4BG0334190 [Eleusine coracana subsp. coracana]
MDTNSTSAGSGSHGQGRSSRCVTEVITATHHFEVPDFSLLDGIGIGKSVSSSTFRVGGCDWNFRLYPDGFKPTTEGETAASVSVLLCLRKGAAVVNAEFDFILLDKHGKASELAASGSPLKHTFESVGESWGMGTFVEKSAELQTFLRLNDDTLRIMCVLTVTKESPSRAVTPTIAVPPANLQQDLAYMLKDGRCKDVTFSVDGQLFDAHRCVLAARSPVFEVELFGQPKKKPEHYCIQIDDMEPAVFEALLHFIYTDTLPAGSDDATGDDNNLMRMQHLLVAAIRYGLERLQLMCEAKLCDAIDVLTVGMILGLAEQHHCVRLKDACLRYIASGDVLSSVMVKHLSLVDRDDTHQLWPAQQEDPSSFILSETFQAVGQHCGLHRFFPKPRLRQLLSRTGGWFIVRCLVTVVKESQSENDAVKAIVVRARRKVPVFNFRADLFGPMKKKPAQGIQVDDVDPAIFEALLHFIYTDSLPKKCNINDSVIAQQLLVAADQYGLERLRTVCEDKLSRSMDVKTVVSTLVLADKAPLRAAQGCVPRVYGLLAGCARCCHENPRIQRSCPRRRDVYEADFR